MLQSEIYLKRGPKPHPLAQPTRYGSLENQLTATGYLSILGQKAQES